MVEKNNVRPIFLIGSNFFCLATTPSYGHPSFPKEGTTPGCTSLSIPSCSLSFRRLGSLEQPPAWLLPHKGEQIPHLRRRLGWGEAFFSLFLPLWRLSFGENRDVLAGCARASSQAKTGRTARQVDRPQPSQAGFYMFFSTKVGQKIYNYFSLFTFYFSLRALRGTHPVA